MSNFKVDWINHLIGFLTALIGIVIAFQLDDWQERKRDEEKLRITLKAIKGEIDNNREIYKSDALALSDWVEYWTFMRSHDADNNGEMIATEREIDLMKVKQPTRFSGIKFIKKHRDSLNVYGPLFAVIDIIPKSGISTSSWEAAKSSGVLSSLDHTRMTELTKIYDWINKDLGINDAEVLRNTIGFEDGFSNIDTILRDYKEIAGVYGLKLRQVDIHYDAIDWNVE